MKQPLDCDRIILQLGIPTIRYEMWKANNTIRHTYTVKVTEKKVPLPKPVG
ncbi:hypothetical protein [Paenibacillus sp. OAS669]|uniref:hypothetical protein n=1 Tax=Paenibacillus sp. OAS669 TaxID=2663821 RepID=UPI001789FD99|nr:hypothetical protein [Paenibacillus sp. OAS669]MBE1442184.1 hypothetical protein [Paenibacillus sp. OAS669]